MAVSAVESEEQLDRFRDQFHLLAIVELQPKSAGGTRRRQRRRKGTSLKQDAIQSGARGVESGRRPDHASADYHQICRARRLSQFA